jgi:hypothetical protein
MPHVARPAEHPVGERDDDQQDELFRVDEARARIDREERRDERRRAVRGQRPEHRRHFDALVVANEKPDPEQGRDREEDVGRGDRQLQRRREGEKRKARGALQRRRRQRRHRVEPDVVPRARRLRPHDARPIGGPYSARSAAAITAPGISCVRHRKSPGAQTR